MAGLVNHRFLGLLTALLVWSLAASPGWAAKPATPAKAAKKKAHVEEFVYRYTAREGDNSLIVASMYGVSETRLRAWNKDHIDKHGRIKAGKEIKIRSTIPIRPKRKNYYIVKKGDSLGKIGKRVGMDHRLLKKLNGLRSDRISPGQQLVYLLSGPEKPSESVGLPSSGRLVDGEKMPEGPGYSYGNRPNVYGTNETITLLLDCIGAYKKKYPSGPDVVVGNLSAKNGGHLSPHKSHQSGRDFDIGYIHGKKLQPVTRMLPTDAKNMDAEKTWFLLKCFLDTKKVKVIFMNYEVQEPLVKYLQKKKYKKSFLQKTFQYPRGKGTEAVFKHLKGHHTHAHVRFLCPKGDKRCVN